MPRKAKTQPIQAGPSQSYGERTKLENAQKAMPLPQTQGVPQVPMTPGAPPSIPGARGGFNRPSARPDEPVTTGLPIGAGAGPEVLQAAPNPNAELAKGMRGYMPALELIANLPTSSVQSRNFVRRVRGLLPGEGVPQ